ncbi:MAG: nicotinate phosphoribosyltransferase [Clostridia bacterium]|nr:nicotinate phosphoribosyltransferase [Clostridia bacterium]
MDVKRNLTMLCDYYELTMGNGYLKAGIGDRIVYFDVFYRNNPDNGGYAIAAGLEQVIEYIENLKFTDEDIEFLRSKGCFCEEFLEYLRNFKFTGDIWAIPEGTVVFPSEPLMVVKAPAIEAQFIETYVLMMINHQSLIATKASRLTRAAKGRAVSEFGSRRAQGADAAMLGARAAYIGGVGTTACTIVDRDYDVPCTGTMAHSWVQMFDSEYEAFKTYCEIYPNNATLLVDTFNVLESGIPNAIKVFKEMGITKCGVRIDSGDITYLTKKVRKMLDDAGLTECRIVISNSLDEYLIRELIRQGAEVDAFGVGERLITAKSDPVFGGVYKLCAVEGKNGEVIPKIKISENVGKITTPHFKKLYRLRDKETGKAEADLLCVYDETVDDTKPIELFDPEYTWKRKTLTNYTAEELHHRIYEKGKLVYKIPTIHEIRKHCQEEIEGMWDEVRRFSNPHNYYVDLSQKLWDIKHAMISEHRKIK